MKVIDITEKLDLGGNTILMIAGEELEVKTDAKTALILIDKISKGGTTSKEAMEICNLIFTKESREKLDEMNLSFKDFMAVIRSAIDAITGENDVGEELTHTTI